MKKGISLVALVITIIVLIILTGTIVLTVLDVNLFERAEQARDERNKQEVYSAVQREVLDVQASKIGLAVSQEFATELQTRLLNKHSNSKATATYSTATDSIAITFDLNNKTYNLTLDNKYRLTFVETSPEMEQFIVDLTAVMEQYFNPNDQNPALANYDLAAIQKEMDKKYPDAEYLYLIAYYIDENREKAQYIPIALGSNLDAFVADMGSVTSSFFTAEIDYKGNKKVIEGTELKNTLEYEKADYITKTEAEKLYSFSNNTITKYKGGGPKVTIPRNILAESGEDYCISISTIGEKAFAKVSATKVDLVTEMLGTTYEVYNSMDVIDLVLNAEGISDVSQSQIYTEGMTKDEYVEKIIQANGGEVYKEDGHLYAYMTSEGDFTTKPSNVDITEIIIPGGKDRIDISTYAFKDNSNLKTIRFNTRIGTIARFGLAYCDGLTDIYMPFYTMEQVQALANYSEDKWGAPSATIHCSDGDL